MMDYAAYSQKLIAGWVGDQGPGKVVGGVRVEVVGVDAPVLEVAGRA